MSTATRPFSRPAHPLDNWDTFLSELRKQIDSVDSTQCTDRKGRIMKLGDIVRFSTSVARTDHTGPNGSRSRRADIQYLPPQNGDFDCTDVVERRYGSFCGWCYDTDSGVYLWRLTNVCEVVGSIFSSPDKLKEGLMRFNGKNPHLGPFLRPLVPLSTGRKPEGDDK